MELLIKQSGGQFVASSFARDTQVSVPTITNYLNILEDTFVVHVLRPYHASKTTEIIAAPKVYAFDTGLYAYYKGWQQIRQDDRGILWEHLILNELSAYLPATEILYWRDKKKKEIDFIVKKRGSDEVITIETKWQSKNFATENLLSFRALHPKGSNYVVCRDVQNPFVKKLDGLELCFINLEDLISKIK